MRAGFGRASDLGDAPRDPPLGRLVFWRDDACSPGRIRAAIQQDIDRVPDVHAGGPRFVEPHVHSHRAALLHAQQRHAWRGHVSRLDELLGDDAIEGRVDHRP